MKGFLTVLIIVLTISSCNTDDSEPTVPICTEGTINVVHTQIDTIQHYTLADEFEEGVYRITSDEEFAAFFNEPPPAINYDSLTLLVAVVDAGDYTFTESIQTSFDCEAQMLKLDHSLYNYEENIDTLKYWRHVLVDSKFVLDDSVKFKIKHVPCEDIQTLEFTDLYSEEAVLVSEHSIPLFRNFLYTNYIPTCYDDSDELFSLILNSSYQLGQYHNFFFNQSCIDFDFTPYANFENGSLILHTVRLENCTYELKNVSINCQKNSLNLEIVKTQGCLLEPVHYTIIIPLLEKVRNEYNVTVQIL